MRKCPVLEELDLITKKTVRSKAASDRVRSYDVGEREKISELKRRIKVSERKPAVSRTAPQENISRKREENVSGSESSGGPGSRKMRRPRIHTGLKEQSVRTV